MVRVEDWDLVASNVRDIRTLCGLSQRQLAQRAGVALSTVYHAEDGRPLQRRTLERICEGLQCPLELVLEPRRELLASGVDFVLHRSEKARWVSLGESRAKVPEGDASRIQSPGERLRLGRLGLVSLFVRGLTFIMPEGPGPLQLELYGRFEEALNAGLYRDCILMCTEGEVQIQIADRTATLEGGDALGYRSADLRWMEPAGAELPVRLLWIGAIRQGKFSD